eukprot:scaffold26052_cov108-Cylindrotheca_fusiformis.AAC.4
MVPETVSMIQPRTFLQVDHEASPLRSLATEMGSDRWGGSWGWSGRRTWSMEAISRRRTERRVLGEPWAAAMKSSTKRSMAAKRRRCHGKHGVGVGGRRRGIIIQAVWGSAATPVETRIGECQGEGHKGRLARCRRDGNAQLGDVFKAEPDSIESILDVYLYEVDWAKPRVAVNDLCDESFQSPAKLHGLSWHEGHSFLVEARVGVVHDGPRTPFVLGYYSHGRDAQVWEVGDF